MTERTPTPDLVDLVAELREALGLFAGAMPISPKQAWEEALAEVARLRRIERDRWTSWAHPRMPDLRDVPPIDGSEAYTEEQLRSVKERAAKRHHELGLDQDDVPNDGSRT